MDRVWVVGPCGAGKSTVARTIAARLGVEPTHIDELHWRPGWVEAPRAETLAALSRVVQRPRWVVDGNYGDLRRRLACPGAFFLWLDLPLAVTFPRLVRRCVVRSLRRETICNGNRESLRLAFFDRDSILLWALTSHRRRKRKLLEDLAGRPHVRLRSQRALDRWLRRTRMG